MPFQATPLNMVGISQDPSPENIPPTVWNKAINVRFGEFAANKGSGYIDLAGPALFAPERLQFIENLNQLFWLYYGPDGVGVWDGTTHSDITPVGYTSGTRDLWSDTQLNGVAVSNNFIDGPLFWDFNTTNPLTLLPGWPNGVAGDPTWRCNTMSAFKFNLFAFGMREDGVELNDVLRWSASAAPGNLPSSWIPTASNDAGSLPIGGTRGRIIDAVALRDQLLVFKTDSSVSILPVGGTLIYGQRDAYSTIGMLAPRCGIEYRGRAIVLTDKDVVLTDGVEVESIIDDRNRRALFRELDSSLFQRSFMAWDPVSAKVAIFIPSINHPNPGSECNVVYVWDPRDGEWSISVPGDGMSDYALGFHPPPESGAWDNDPEEWDLDGLPWSEGAPSNSELTLASFESELIYGVAAGNLQANGKTIEMELEKLALQFGDVDRITYMNQIWVSADGTYGAQFTVEAGGHDQGTDQPVYGAPITMTVGEDKQRTLEASGRFIALRFKSIGDTNFRINGMRINWRDGGRYAA